MQSLVIRQNTDLLGSSNATAIGTGDWNKCPSILTCADRYQSKIAFVERATIVFINL